MSNMKLWNKEVQDILNSIIELEGDYDKEVKEEDTLVYSIQKKVIPYIYGLENAALLLDCLREQGVDNWAGYPDAVEQQEELIKEYLNEQN